MGLNIYKLLYCCGSTNETAEEDLVKQLKLIFMSRILVYKLTNFNFRLSFENNKPQLLKDVLENKKTEALRILNVLNVCNGNNKEKMKLIEMLIWEQVLD